MQSEPRTQTVYLGLGSSLGDRRDNLRNALHRLDSLELRIVAVSPVYQSPHLGLKPGDAEKYPPHLNAVAKAETTLPPEMVLRRVQEAENAGGRQRTERWGPRTIDIDILLYGDLILQSDALTVPHPGLAERAFALRPLADLAPDLRLPDSRTVAERLASPMIEAQALECVGPFDWETERR